MNADPWLIVALIFVSAMLLQPKNKLLFKLLGAALLALALLAAQSWDILGLTIIGAVASYLLVFLQDRERKRRRAKTSPTHNTPK